MRYIDPLNGIFGFKKIFTEPDGQPLLLSLLNDVRRCPDRLPGYPLSKSGAVAGRAKLGADGV